MLHYIPNDPVNAGMKRDSFMKAVIQRVTEAKVTVEGSTVGAIGKGLVILVGVERGDDERSADWLAEKIVNLRLFSDNDGKMNLSLIDADGQILSISQFTLAGNCNKGRRPSFDGAAVPEEANRIYEYFNNSLRRSGVTVATGIFQTDMQVSLTNDGPVTFILESPKKG